MRTSKPTPKIIPPAPRRVSEGQRAVAGVLLVCLMFAVGLSPRVARGQESAPVEAGYIRLANARTAESAFRWEDGVFAGERCLVWPGGVLTLPRTMVLEEFGAADILVPFTEAMRGMGPDGKLLFRDGRYEIDQPLLLRDGPLSVYLAAGVLEIRSGRIDYVWREKTRSSRGQYLILAGVVLAIFILFTRARRYGKT